MRAVVLDEAGEPRLADVSEPDGPGIPVRILACGLCGSDVEKIGKAPAGTVLGHEVVGEDADGRRLALLHHSSCGHCARCRAGHESTCDRFREQTIVPGGFAERAGAADGFELPTTIDDATGTVVEPLACVLRGAERVPAGRGLVVGQGFVGRLFAAILALRGNEVFTTDARPERAGREPDGPVDAAVLCAPGGANEAAAQLEPGGTLLVFGPSAPLDLDAVYRRELYVIGSRSATPRHMRRAVKLLPELELPPIDVLPLDRFAEGLARYRSGDALKVVFTP